MPGGKFAKKCSSKRCSQLWSWGFTAGDKILLHLESLKLFLIISAAWFCLEWCHGTTPFALKGIWLSPILSLPPPKKWQELFPVSRFRCLFSYPIVSKISLFFLLGGIPIFCKHPKLKKPLMKPRVSLKFKEKDSIKVIGIYERLLGPWKFKSDSPWK